MTDCAQRWLARLLLSCPEKMAAGTLILWATTSRQSLTVWLNSTRAKALGSFFTNALAKLSELTKAGESVSCARPNTFRSVVSWLAGPPAVNAATMRSAEVVLPPASARSFSDQSSWA
ncbi:hypothetical protein POHY109586_24490 [Polaromonas hydrogenivorans]